jgi:hypothetical protein
MHAIQFLLEELISGSVSAAGLTGEGPSKELLRWQQRFQRVPHALGLRAHLTQLTDVSQLWFREFYLEQAGCVQVGTRVSFVRLCDRSPNRDEQ